MISLAELIHILAPLATRGLTDAALKLPVTAVVSDSRQVVAGSLFVAVRGEKADGHAYIPEAIRRGCAAVVVDLDDGLDLTAPVIVVADSHAAISEAAAAWNGYPAERMRMIGITGTNGKTTCSWLIEEMLLTAGFRPGVIGTVNYRYHGPNGVRVIQDAPLTTPDPATLQRLLRIMAEDGVTHVIMEVSSHALQQQRLGRTCFDAALFTNLSRDHLDYHQTMDSYFEAKKLLFQRCLKPGGVAAAVVGPHAEGCNWGELLVSSLAGTPFIRCGLSDDCAVRASGLRQSVEGFRCSLDLQGEQKDFSSKLTGDFNVLNVLAAAGVGLALGLDREQVRAGLAKVGNVPGRLERVRLDADAEAVGPAVFVDYAHTPDALENVLQTLKALTAGRLVCVFGCGGDRDRGKRPLMGALAAQYADVAVVTSDNPRSEDPEAIIAEIVVGAAASGKARRTLAEMLTGSEPKPGYTAICDRKAAIAAACSLAEPGDSVLIAGKGHENYQIIGSAKHFFDDRLEARNGLLRWNLRHLLAATGGRLAAGGQRAVCGGISTDSRRLQEGDVFVALKGEAFDGNQYIEAAAERGASVIVAEQPPSRVRPGTAYIVVDDGLHALGAMAAYRRRLVGKGATVAAITGSSGKTSVKEMVAGIFAEALRNEGGGIDPVLKTQGNFNNLVGMPLSLLPLEAGHRLAVIEMGMSVPGEIARLAAIADPDIGCINNVHPAHLQGLGSLAGVAAAKGELFAGMRPDAVRVVNFDDPQVRAQAKKSGGKQIGFAVTPSGRKHAPLIRVDRQRNLGEQGMRFTLHIGAWQARITVPALGAHNVSNCAAAAAIAHAAGIAPEIIVRGLQQYAPAVDKRLAVVELPGGLKAVNDAYNANPASMAAGLRTVAALGAPGCRHAAALGDMLELGDASDALHAGIGTLAASLGYRWLALTGPHSAVVAQAAVAGGMSAEQVRAFPDPSAMAAWFCGMLAAGDLKTGDWLLIKGSRGMRMERLLDALEQQLTTEH